MMRGDGDGDGAWEGVAAAAAAAEDEQARCLFGPEAGVVWCCLPRGLCCPVALCPQSPPPSSPREDHLLYVCVTSLPRYLCLDLSQRVYCVCFSVCVCISLTALPSLKDLACFFFLSCSCVSSRARLPPVSQPPLLVSSPFPVPRLVLVYSRRFFASACDSVPTLAQNTSLLLLLLALSELPQSNSDTSFQPPFSLATGPGCKVAGLLQSRC